MNYVLLLMFIPFTLLSQMVSEEILLTNNAVELPGTLTYNSVDDKMPLVIFIHGSGNVDRDGNQAGTPVQVSYIKSLADSLIKKNIAFYRYDKRTANLNNRDILTEITVLDFVEDAKIAVQYFKDDKRFSTIHLIGHSQGSLVAMKAVTKIVKSYISIAGPAYPIDQIIVGQLAKQNVEFSKVAEAHFDELHTTDTILSVNAMAASMFPPQMMTFWKTYIHLNPSEEIKKLKVPMLIIQGTADLQVSEDDARALQKANPKAELVIIPNMNHILKEVKSLEENQQSYSDKTIALSSELIEKLSEFIIAQK